MLLLLLLLPLLPLMMTMVMVMLIMATGLPEVQWAATFWFSSARLGTN